MSRTFSLAQLIVLLWATFLIPGCIIPVPKDQQNKACPTPVEDGQIVFIRSSSTAYAVQIDHQTLQPEQATFRFIEIGSSSPIETGATTKDFPIIMNIGDLPVWWSGDELGKGFLYFSWGHEYDIGEPFVRGNLESYRKGVPDGIVFHSDVNH